MHRQASNMVAAESLPAKEDDRAIVDKYVSIQKVAVMGSGSFRLSQKAPGGLAS